jgi:hypothetical protein
VNIKKWFSTGPWCNLKKICFYLCSLWALRQIVPFGRSKPFCRSEQSCALSHSVALRHFVAVRRSSPQSNSFAPRNFCRSELISRSRYSPSFLTLHSTHHCKFTWNRGLCTFVRRGTNLPNIEYGSNSPHYSSIASTRLASLPTTTKTKLNETKTNPTLPYRISSRNPLRFGFSIVEWVL